MTQLYILLHSSSSDQKYLYKYAVAVLSTHATHPPSFPSSPLQSNPLLASSNPLLQLHVKDPSVSVHVCAHPPLFVAHLFTFVSVYKIYPTPWNIGANSQSYSYHIRRYAHSNFKKTFTECNHSQSTSLGMRPATDTCSKSC